MADSQLQLGSAIDGTKFPIEIKDAGIGTDGVTASVLVEVDTNISKDGDDSGDAKDDDVDITFVEVLTLAVLNNEAGDSVGGATPIVITPVSVAGAPKVLAADVTVKENASGGHRFGRVSVMGSLTGTGPAPASETLLENLDGVITDSGRFVVRTNSRGAVATILSLEYTGTEAIAAGEVYEMILSVNGDTGFVNRTATSNVRVTISAANLAPSADAEQSSMVREDDPKSENLIKMNSVIGTVSASDNESLTFSIDDLDFKIDNNGVITAKRPIPDAEKDNSDTKADDEDLEYNIVGLAGWTYVGGETTSDSADQDITRKVMVTVSDGVESNDQDVEFTVTIDVNQAACASH